MTFLSVLLVLLSIILFLYISLFSYLSHLFFTPLHKLRRITSYQQKRDHLLQQFQRYIQAKTSISPSPSSSPSSSVSPLSPSSSSSSTLPSSPPLFVCSSRSQDECMTTRNTYLAYKSSSYNISLENFDSILQVNTNEGYVVAETRVTIGDMISHLISRYSHWIPIVPELRTLTIGGLISGAGIESSSHIYGLFHHSVMEYEILNHNGQIMNITPLSHPQLFFAFPFSCGSIGILLSAKMKILPIPSNWVKITYERTNSIESTINLLAKYSGCDMSVEGKEEGINNSIYKNKYTERGWKLENNDVNTHTYIPPSTHILTQLHSDHKNNKHIITTSPSPSSSPYQTQDFVEGILYTPNEGLIISANFVSTEVMEKDISKRGGKGKDAGKGILHRIKWYSMFWHEDVRRKFFAPSSSSSSADDNTNRNDNYNYMPLLDYLFRHDRGTFWTVERKFPISLNPFFRFFFGLFLDSRLRRLSFLSDRGSSEEIRREQKRVIQDPIVPLVHAVKSLQKFDFLFGIRPVWLCPFKHFHPPPSSPYLLKFSDHFNFYLDIGLYAKPTTVNYSALNSHREMEKFLRDVKGFSAPYAVNYSTRKEFYATYDEGLYNKMRELYGGKGVWVDLYDKIGGGKKVEKSKEKEEDGEQTVNGRNEDMDTDSAINQRRKGKLSSYENEQKEQLSPSPSPSPEMSPTSSNGRSQLLSFSDHSHPHLHHSHSDKGPSRRRTQRAE